MYDTVNKPKHYMLFEEHNIEVRDVLKVLVEKIKASEYNKPMVEADYVQCMQYLMRFMSKNGIEDLEKAAWYLDKLTKTLRGHSFGYNKGFIHFTMGNDYLEDVWYYLIRPYSGPEETLCDFKNIIEDCGIWVINVRGKIAEYRHGNGVDEFRKLSDEDKKRFEETHSYLKTLHGIK